jgi:hypothetical protein
MHTDRKFMHRKRSHLIAISNYNSFMITGHTQHHISDSIMLSTRTHIYKLICHHPHAIHID